ncbi:MAG TPA: flagellar basal body-associated FliL family protein [Arenibaculum sp.]|nr:flagellar basal body-associated FliL family protein [Arenibaculum sp.]
MRLPRVLLLSLALAVPPGMVPAVAAAQTGLLVPVNGMVLPLFGADLRPIGAMQLDLRIEASGAESVERITVLVPRIRDALISGLRTRTGSGLDVSAAQLERMRRLILDLVRGTVGEGAVAAVHFGRVLTGPS